MATAVISNFPEYRRQCLAAENPDIYEIYGNEFRHRLLSNPGRISGYRFNLEEHTHVIRLEGSDSDIFMYCDPFWETKQKVDGRVKLSDVRTLKFLLSENEESAINGNITGTRAYPFVITGSIETDLAEYYRTIEECIESGEMSAVIKRMLGR